MSHIVVSGASGFLGRQLVPLLHHRGIETVALVRDPANAPIGMEHEIWDASGHSAPKALEGASAVIHLASHIPADFRDPEQAARCLAVNMLGTELLARGAAAAGVPAFVHTSSGNLYGSGAEAAAEGSPLVPSQRAPYYLTSKLAQELIAERAYLSADSSDQVRRLVTIRPSAIYGPGMTSGVVPLFAGRISRGEPLTINSPHYAVDLVFSLDVAIAVLQSVERSVSGPVNVGSGTSTTLRQLAQTLMDVLGGDAGLIEELDADPEDHGYAPLDISVAQDQLGYLPTSLPEGLKQAFRGIPR